MEKNDYQTYTVEELELIAPYDPEAAAELERRRAPEPSEPKPDPAPEPPAEAEPAPADRRAGAEAYAETMARLGDVEQHVLNRRWREQADAYAGLVYAAKLLHQSDTRSEQTAAMDMLLTLEGVFKRQLREDNAAPRLALRDVQLFLAGGYRSGVCATGDPETPEELAFRRYENAYELDPGCVGPLAWCWQTGCGTRKDPKRAVELLEAAHDDSAASWKRLGDAYALLGWNAKAEECRAAAEQLTEKQKADERKRRPFRQRLSKRTLRIIAGVLAAVVVGELVLVAALRGRDAGGQTAETAAETQRVFANFRKYYGILDYEDDKKYSVDAEFLPGEDGTVVIDLQLHLLTGSGASPYANEWLTGTLEDDESLSFASVGTLKPSTLHWEDELYFEGKLFDKPCNLTLYVNNQAAEQSEEFYVREFNLLFGDAKWDADPELHVESAETDLFEGGLCTNGISIEDSMSPVGEASLVAHLDGKYKRLTFESRALEERGGRGHGTYQIWKDGVLVSNDEIDSGDWETSSVRTVDVTGVKELKIVLISENGGANGNSDHGLVNLFVYDYEI